MRSPHPLFDPEYYLSNNPDVAAAGADPLAHFIQHGGIEGRDPHPLFDSSWYLERNPDVAAVGDNPLLHYLAHGWKEGRDPHPDFSTSRYLAQNPDVNAAGVNPLLHYLEFGEREGRRTFKARKLDEPIFSRDPLYDQWIKEVEQPALTKESLHTLGDAAGRQIYRPKIAVVMPTYNTPEKYLRAAIESVISQAYGDWELCIADDFSDKSHVKFILEDYQRKDPRIKIVFRKENGRISHATNSAFQLVTAPYVALLDHDDVLRPHTLAEVVMEINRRPDAQIVYSDEDKIDAQGMRYDAYFKPDFSRELFRSSNYLNHLTVHRTENIRRVGGWRSDFDGSQDYDLNLRIFEIIDETQICHIPKILYHWRAIEGSTALTSSEKPHAYVNAIKALHEHVERSGLAAEVIGLDDIRYARLRFTVPSPEPLVSILIPTRDNARLLHRCLESILLKTAYTNYEIIIIDNDSRDQDTFVYFEEIRQRSNVRIVEYPGAYNYSAIHNRVVPQARGSIIGMVNNDIEVISPDWLTEMVSWAVRTDVGCVGAKLYYEDDTVQHAGVIIGMGGVAGHAHKHQPRDGNGYFGNLRLLQNVSAVTAACMLFRKHIYEEVGGMDEVELPVAFNDVDFCLKVRQAGYKCVWTPYAELYHYESRSRGYEDTPEKKERAAREVETMKRRWGKILQSDPYYSKNLSLLDEKISYTINVV